ncbi:MAG: TolC family protein [Bacteroidia bacterium]|nr:TolC family protein [Bacteroidia bacterium]
MKPLTKSIAIILATILNAAFGQTHKFSIKECTQFGLENKSEVRSARLTLDSVTYFAREIMGIGLPQINATINSQYFVQLPTSLIPAKIFNPMAPEGTMIPIQFGTKYNTTASLDFTQLAFDGDFFVGLAAARNVVYLFSKATERSQTETVAAIQKAYYNCLVNQKRIGLIEANLEKLQKLKIDTEKLYQGGVVEKIDLDRIEVTINNLKTEYEKAKQLVTLSLNLLKFQMGMDLGSDLVLTDTLTTTPTALNLVEASVDIEKRVEFQLLKIQNKLYNLDRLRHVAGFVPTLYLFGSISSQAMRNEFSYFDTKRNWFATGVVGFRLTLPIFDGLRRKSRVEQANVAIKKNELDQQNFTLAVQLELKNAVTTYNNSIRSVEIQQRNLELAQEVYRLAKVKYDKGTGMILDIVNADASRKESEINYLNALLEVNIAKVDLLKAQGLLLE